MSHIAGYTDNKPKMKQYATKVINLIGGPGCNKSLMMAAIMLNLKLMHKSVEYVPEYARGLVLQKDWEGLKNQHYIALQQYNMLSVFDGAVQYIITDGPLAQLLFYNENYAENICDISKTKAEIVKWMSAFQNINIFVQRGDTPYNGFGRYQDEETAKEMDGKILELLIKEKIDFSHLTPDVHKINEWCRKVLLEK